MLVATALSANPVAAHATGEVLADLLERIGPAPAIALVIVTPSFGGTLDDIRSTIETVLSPRSLVCAVSSGVIADGVEIDGRPAIAIWAADTCADVIWTDTTGTSHRAVGEIGDRGAAFVLLDSLELGLETATELARLDSVLPQHEIAGGVLSSAAGPSRLVAPDGQRASAVAIVLDDVAAATIWGAAPIDEVRFARVVDGNMVTELDDHLPLDVIVGSLGVLGEDDRREVSRHLRLALLGPDEFGVVPVLGTDRSTGAIAIGGHCSDGSLVQLLRGDPVGLHDSIIRTLLPLPGPRLVASTGLDGISSLDPEPVTLLTELSEGRAVGPVVAAVVSTTRGGTMLVDAPIVVVTCERCPD